MENFIAAYVFLIGLAIGSFLNVLIYRIPLKLSIAKGNSFCPNCNHKLIWIDLFPLFSYLFLLGKCRYCKAKIKIRYPIVEFINAACFLGVYLMFGLSLISLIYAVCCSCLIVLAFIDIDHMILPDRFIIFIAVCGVILAIFSRDILWLDRVIGFFVISVPLVIISIITGGGGIGEGDIKLFAAIGLLIGWKLTLLTLLFAAIIASIYGIALIIIKKASGKSSIPFGPFISFSAIFAIFAGNSLIDMYLSLIIR